MTNLLKIAAVSLGLLATAGCSTTIRNVTATYWTGEGLYVGYWEGNCKPMLGCNIGDGKAQWCALQPDNSLVCTEQNEVSALLSRSQ